METRKWRIYGAEGHRQRESFGKSEKYDWSNEEDGARIIEVLRQDKTSTNRYVDIIITRETEEECEEELEGQLSDGIFENDRTGKVVELKQYVVYYHLRAWAGEEFGYGYTGQWADELIEAESEEEAEELLIDLLHDAGVTDEDIEDNYCIKVDRTLDY